MLLTLQPSLVNIPLQGLPLAAAALDGNGAIIAANHQFVRLCGRPAVSHPGQRFADIVAEPDRPALEEALRGLTCHEDRGPQKCSIRALRAEPPSIWLAIDVARLGPESIVPYLACLHAIPISRRRARPPLGRVPNRCARSHHAGSPLVTSSVPKAPQPWPAYLAMLSHELRGPLTAIRGWAYMAESGVLPPEKISRALSIISRNATTLTDLIETLFDLSRHAAGSLVLTRQRLDLNPLAQLVVESCLPAARLRNVTLTVTQARAPLPVSGDPLRLEQVVRNLVDNAIKFTPAGGHVHMHTGTDGVFAELVVTDNGLGISPELMPVIFEPFRYDDAMIRPSQRGLGFGLALVRELVHLHDGYVRALSGGKAQGSTFIVRLPLVGTVEA